MSFLSMKITSVIVLVTQLGSGLTLLKALTRAWTAAWLKVEGSDVESLVCAAGGHLPTPLVSWYQVSVRSQMSA